MSQFCDSYTAEDVLKALGTSCNAPHVVVLSEVDSTNTEARRRFCDGTRRPTLLLAHSQTAGRGRLGRSFHSPDTGIYFSLLYPLSGELPSAVSITCAASVAVMRAIRNTVGAETDVKWVNDLYLGGKKVCGILTEAVTMGAETALIVGIGINLRPTAFPPELESIAGSLNDEKTPRAVLAAAILRELLPYLADPADKSWLEDYRRRSTVLGRRVTFTESGRAQGGIATAINERGELEILQDDGRVTTLRTGEITLRLQS